MTVAKSYPENVQWKSFCSLMDKNETSSLQPCISRYCRLWFAYLVRDRELLRCYFTDPGLTAFNQPLADQDLSGLFPKLYPSGVEWIPVPTLGHLTNFSDNKPFANGLFSWEHDQSYAYSSSFASTPSCQWVKIQKLKKIFSRVGLQGRKN